MAEVRCMFLILAAGAALLLGSLLSYGVAMALILHVGAALLRRGYLGRGSGGMSA